MAALKVLHEVTACIYKGEEKPVMKWSFLTKVENKDLKSFLQALNAFGVDQRAKELGIQDYKLKLQCKRLTPEPEFRYQVPKHITLNDVIMVTGITGIRTTRINGIRDILAKN